MARKKISTTVYLDPDDERRLQALSARTHVPMAVYVRMGLRAVLDRHEPAQDVAAPEPPRLQAVG